MDAFIFGVGCSGTTMSYNLLQGVFTNLYGENYFSSYEPFIWDKDKFNIPYKDASALFGRTSSLSVEGIYFHTQTPMFITGDFNKNLINNKFFNRFSSISNFNPPHLVKFIRGNGRMPLFRKLNPEAKFLLMLRNPMDNINCAKYKFSFYGEDFYPSDYPRFCEELEDHLFMKKEVSCWAQRQAEYCYQMNRAALEFAVADENTLIFEYDEFIKNKRVSLSKLCKLLNIPFNPSLLKALETQTGPSTGNISLSQAEFEAIFPYSILYKKLCKKMGIRTGKRIAEIERKYNGKCTEDNLNTDYIESTTNPLRHIIRRQKRQIAKLSEK